MIKIATSHNENTNNSTNEAVLFCNNNDKKKFLIA